MPGRDDDRAGGDPVTVGELHDVLAAPALQADGGLREHQVRAEHPGLLARLAGELMPADAMREARVIADHRAASGLPAGNGLLDHHRLQAFGCGIDGGGQARRSRSHDDDIARADVGADAPAGRLDNLGERRLGQRVVVVADHDRQPRCVQAVVLQQPAALLAVGGVEAERHVEPGEQLPQFVRAAVLGPADDAEQIESGFLVLGPVSQELADRRGKDPVRAATAW